MTDDGGLEISHRYGTLKDGTWIAQIKVEGLGDEVTIGPYKSRDEAVVECEKAISKIMFTIMEKLDGKGNTRKT